MTPSFDDFLSANQHPSTPRPANPPPAVPVPAVTPNTFDGFLDGQPGQVASSSTLPPTPSTKAPSVGSAFPALGVVQPAGQSLDEIIRHLPTDGASRRCGPGEFLYSYHKAQRDACEHQKRPFMSRMKLWAPDEYVYFLVRPNRLVRLPFFDVELVDASGRARVIECRISVLGLAENHEAKAVAGLAEPPAPTENFQAHVRTWLHEYVFAERHRGGDSLQDFNEAQRAAAGQYLADRALDALGLRIACKFAFPEHDLRLPLLTVHLDDVRVQETGLPGPLASRLEVRLDLPRDRQDLTAARRLSRSLATIQQDLAGMAREWFQHECSLERFAFDREGVQQALEARVRRYAQTQLGMELSSLTVQNSLAFPTSFRLRAKYTSTATVQGNHKLQVEHQLGVERHDLGLFYTQGPRLPTGVPCGSQPAWNQAFEDWAHLTLDEQTDSVLFDKSYAEVGLNFEELCVQIREKVKGAFKVVGFNVNPFITMPGDIQIQNCLERKFAFDTEAVHCKTREAKVDYSVSAHVRFEVDSLEKIKKYLQPGQPLKEHFIEAAKEAIENAVRTLTPEALYTRFESPGPHGELSPEQTIREAVQTAVKDKFDAIVEDDTFRPGKPRNRRAVAITLTPEPTDVTKLYDQLQPYSSHRCPIVVETRGSQGESVEMNVLYRLTSIAPDGWSKFQEQCRKNPEMETKRKADEIKAAIDTTFQTKASSRLVSLPPDLLLSPHQDVPKVIEQVSLNEAVKEVAEFLGLAVRITDIERPLGKWSRRGRDLAEEDYKQTEQDYREARLRLRTAETEYGPDDDRTREAADRLDRCKKALDGFTNRDNQFFANVPGLLPPRWDHLQLASPNVAAQAAPTDQPEAKDKAKPYASDESDLK